MRLAIVLLQSMLFATCVNADEPRPAVILSKTEGYARLECPSVKLSAGEYQFSCLMTDDIRFGETDHIPGLWGGDIVRTNISFKRQADGWYKYSCSMKVLKDGTYDFQLALWNYEEVVFADLSLKKVGDDQEILPNKDFSNGLAPWRTRGGKIAHLTSRMPEPAMPRLAGQRVVYTSFFKDRKETLYGFESDKLILLIPSVDAYPAKQVEQLLLKLQTSWKYFEDLTGSQPGLRTTTLEIDGQVYRNWKPTLAVVNETCGAGCGLVGGCGIEMLPAYWEQTWQKHLGGKETRGLFEYEMGRNFWLFHSQLHSPDAANYHLATAFASVFGFKAGVAAGSTDDPGNEAVDYVASYREEFSKYLLNPSFDTLLQGGVKAEKIHGGLWLYLGEKCGEEFYGRYFRALTKLPPAKNIEEAVDNHITACSEASGKDLAPWFHKKLKYPMKRE